MFTRVHQDFFLESVLHQFNTSHKNNKKCLNNIYFLSCSLYARSHGTQSQSLLAKTIKMVNYVLCCHCCACFSVCFEKSKTTNCH